MPLKAKPPETSHSRLKLFMYGEPSSGKTTAAIQFPRPYVIDCERGTSNYKALIDANKGVVLQTTDADEVISEVRALTTEKHDYRTLVIDPITMIEADLMEKAEKQFGIGDMRQWAARDRVLKRLLNLLYKLDMNVIVTCHAKPEYAEGGQMKKLGQTHDAWRRWPYAFDLCLELAKQAGKRFAFVKKSRLEKFPDGERFEFSYEEIVKRFDATIMEKAATTIAMASNEQVAKLKELLAVVATPEETVNKWLSKAGVEEFADMNADDIGKCIDFLKKKVEAV